MSNKCEHCGGNLKIPVSKMCRKAPPGYQPTMEFTYFVLRTNLGTFTDDRRLCQKWTGKGKSVWVAVPHRYHASGEGLK